MQNFEVVDEKWLNDKLSEYGLMSIEVSQKIGVSKHQFSKWLNKRVEIGAISQAALYYFFRCLELEKELKK